MRFYPFGLAARNGVIAFYRSTNPIVHSLVSEPGLRGYAPAASCARRRCDYRSCSRSPGSSGSTC